MPRQVFDVEQYELRGSLPQTYTESQKSTLNKVVSRVNGQLDWTAQLLGFNGPRYWGAPSTDRGGEYKFVGLPQTVAEKRALLSGAFGVYNKDKPYESWPAPFNRSAVAASADQTFSISEEEGRVIVWPFGLGKQFSMDRTATLIAGGAYTFDRLVDVSVFGADQDTVELVQDIDQRVSRLRILSDEVSAVAVYLVDSGAKPFTFAVRKWSDPSDWNEDSAREQFLGAWGSKGNQLPMHFAFDALDLHGFNEVEALSLDKVTGALKLEQLLGLIGLKPGPLSALVSAPYNFEVEGCDIEGPFTPSVEWVSTSDTLLADDLLDLLTEDDRSISTDDGFCGFQEAIFMLSDGNDGEGGEPDYDNGFFPDEVLIACFSDNGTFELPGAVTAELSNGVYELSGDFPIEANGIYDIDPLSICETDPDTTPTGLLSNGEYPGDYFPSPGGSVDNDGTYDISIEQLMTEDLRLISANDESFDYSDCYRAPEAEYGVCDTCDYTLTLRQVYDDTPNDLAIDPGPESSTPIGLNGFMREFPVSCGLDNGTFEENIITNFFLDRAETVRWADIVPVDSFDVLTRDSGGVTVYARGGFFEVVGRTQFVSIPPPNLDIERPVVDDGSYGDTDPNAVTKYDLELPAQGLFNGYNDLGLLGNQTTCYSDNGGFDDPSWFVTSSIVDDSYDAPPAATSAEDNGFFDQDASSICPAPDEPFGPSYDWGIVYKVPFDGVVDQQIGEYAIYDGIYDQDPALNCDEPQAPEVDINYFDLVVDAFGEAGPVLVSDSGAGNEITLTAADGDEDGYDGRTIAFDGLEIAELAFDYEAKTPFAMTEFPAVEWVVDLRLDNGSFYPVSDEGAWMGADDGDFDDRLVFVRTGSIVAPFDSASDAIGAKFTGGLLTFDDGEFDEAVEPACGGDSLPPGCDLADGGVYAAGDNPLVADTNCFEECGRIDSGEYRYGFVPPSSPVIDGRGSRTIQDSCTTYDNAEFDRAPRPSIDGQDIYDCTSYDNTVYPFEGVYTCSLEEWGEFDQITGGPIADSGEYANDTFPGQCAPCGPVPDGFDCYLNNGILEVDVADSEVDEGFYDNGFELCAPCVAEVEPVVPCPVPPARIRLDRVLYANAAWRFNPAVTNAESPLRVWKNHVLEVVDDRSDELTSENVGEFLDSKDYHNAFVADRNTGPERPDSYRYFVRLPAEYARNGRQWNKATNVVSSYGYFSSVYPLPATSVKPYNVRPYLYDDVYCQCAEELPDFAVFYHEDYLFSAVKEARIDAEAGFEESRIEFEDAAEAFPFSAGLVTEYDAYEQRQIRDKSGEWAGSYFKWHRRGPLTGYLLTDVVDSRLRATDSTEQLEGDFSYIKAPNTEFPDDTDVANFANYTVGYAYFAADMSAADEPIFDPTAKYNWRECNIPKCEDGTPVFATDITGLEIVTEDGFNIGVGNQPIFVDAAVESRTAYLLNKCEKFVAKGVDLEPVINPPFSGGRKGSVKQPTAAPEITIDALDNNTLQGPITLSGTVANAGSVELVLGTAVSPTITGGRWTYEMTNADFNALLAASPGNPPAFTISATAKAPEDARTAIARYRVTVDQPAAKADFFVITYGFSDGNDLDTRTSFYGLKLGSDPTAVEIQTETFDELDAYTPRYVGWGRESAVDQLTWGGDNTGTGVESVLFDRAAFEEANPGQSQVSFDLRAMWYGSAGTRPVVITVTSYKGGQMVKSGFTWSNPTAEAAYSDFTSVEKVVTLSSRNRASNGERIAIIDLDFSAGTVNYRQT